MCGIVGFIGCGTKEELANSVKVIGHRGPDAQSVKWFPNSGSGLGHARLSIIDLSDRANQPMFDEHKGNWIVFNGEVYNYRSIRSELEKLGIGFLTDSDTEVVLKAYGVWGKETLQKFNGMFAFAIYNEKEDKLSVFRDRLGIKPLYYYHDGDKLAFASELKSILELTDYKKEPDHHALQTPVHYQVTPYTGFKDIYKLPAGFELNFQGTELKTSAYWKIRPSEQKVSFDDAFDKLDELLNSSIDLQMVSDVPIGSLLSGGLDSSLISAMMQKKVNDPIRTFTIKFSREDLKKQGNVDDSFYARKLVEEMGFDHEEILIRPDIVDLLPKMVWHLEEPIADPAAINTYLISKAARDKGVKVLLSGMGADEVFSGYRAHLACLKAEPYGKIPNPLRWPFESALKLLPESNSSRDFKYLRWAKGFVRVASLPQRERAMLVKNSTLNEEQFKSYFADPIDYSDSEFVKTDVEVYNRYPELSYLTKMCYTDSKVYMTDHNLTYSDKAMMAASVEGRPPLIDHRIVEFMFTLPPEFRVNGNVQKYLLKKVAEKYVPKEIIYRPKAPFSAPMRGWLKKELNELVRDTLSEDSVKARGVYNPKYVSQLITENLSGQKDNSQLIWRLLVNELWFRTFFD